MNILLVISLSLICLSALLLVRNSLVYRHRTRAFSVVHERAMEAIYKHKPWEIYHDEYDACASYDVMVFDLTKWRYHAFFPNF